MPLYDYQCRSCGKTFEMLRRMQDAERDLKCPACKSDKVDLLLSGFSTGGCGGGSGPFR